MVAERPFEDEPCYFISIVSRMVGVHAQTLRYYERVGLVTPSRSIGKQRLYSYRDMQKLRQIKALTEDMGVNLAGAEVVIKLMTRITQLEGEVSQLSQELRRLKAPSGRATRSTHSQEA